MDRIEPPALERGPTPPDRIHPVNQPKRPLSRQLGDRPRQLAPQELIEEINRFPKWAEPDPTELRTFFEWLKWDWKHNPLSPGNILSAVRIYHHARSGRYDSSHHHCQPVPPGPPHGPDPGVSGEHRPMRPPPELHWTIRTGIAWTVITTTVFATVAGWHNFFNYLLTAWAFTTFIPAALLVLVWWALPVRHFGSIISLILHGRHHHRRGH